MIHRRGLLGLLNLICCTTNVIFGHDKVKVIHELSYSGHYGQLTHQNAHLERGHQVLGQGREQLHEQIAHNPASRKDIRLLLIQKEGLATRHYSDVTLTFN
jgi:hypothetical protein